MVFGKGKMSGEGRAENLDCWQTAHFRNTGSCKLKIWQLIKENTPTSLCTPRALLPQFEDSQIV